MNDPDVPQEAVYVCAGICRVNPRTNRCAGCGRPWETSPVVEANALAVPATESDNRVDAELP